MSPDVSLAQGLADLAQCSGTDCSACNIVYLANGGIKWLVGFLCVLCAALIAWAGFGLVMSGGNRHALDEAKNTFTNAIIGLIILLSAWLIVDTIMRALVGNDENPGSVQTVNGWLFWSDVQCQVQEEPEYTPHSNDDISMVPMVPGPAGMPVAGTGANCPVPDAGGMVSIPGQERFVATPDTVSRFVQMRTAAAADGITLTVTSAYRSEAEQVQIWTSRGCHNNPSLCSGRAAMPCSYGGNGSNHNSGVALDISVGQSGSATFNWLKRNGGRYGFYNNLDARDPFHWSPSGR